MLTIRKSADRGFADHGWLKSHHSFSFADYFDPQMMGFGNLRVINEDTIDPGAGFGMHGHRNMEIISYVLSGGLVHRDSMGHEQTIFPGDVQRMSAGRGVMHSEFNHSREQKTHFLQIWIQPDRINIDPGYEQKQFPNALKRGKLCLVASPIAEQGAVTIHADAKLYAGLFDAEEACELQTDSNRKLYVHLIRGHLHVNDAVLSAGDALMVEKESQLALSHGQDAEVLVFDLAA